jgi:UDP-N-acetylmuramate dehydrogenase
MRKLTDIKISSFLSELPSIKRDELMSSHTSLKIGGAARLYVVVQSADECVRVFQTAKSLDIPFFVFGGGSNLLVSDDGFEGVIVQFADRSSSINETTITAGAGAITGVLARNSAQSGLMGFEWGVGIPGTVGGAVFGNAGCYGGEMKDVVVSVDVFDISKNDRKTISKTDCAFGYRDSIFKHESHVIFSVELELKKGDVASALRTADEIMAKRKTSQPQGSFSAGCLFKNFEFEDESALEKLRTRAEEIPEIMLTQKRISAGWLIDLLGLKGTKIGNAQISPTHGNFFLNLGGARAQDVVALSSLVKMRVRDDLGIILEDEVQLLGYDH